MLCVAATPETRHLIGAAELGAMKPSALLVNAAGGARWRPADERPAAPPAMGGGGRPKELSRQKQWAELLQELLVNKHIHYLISNPIMIYVLRYLSA